jgi:hypothetical protein
MGRFRVFLLEGLSSERADAEKLPRPLLFLGDVDRIGRASPWADSGGGCLHMVRLAAQLSI